MTPELGFHTPQLQKSALRRPPPPNAHKNRPATTAVGLQQRGEKTTRARKTSGTYLAAPTASFSSSASFSSTCESSSASFSASILAFLSTSIIEMLSS